MFAMIMNTYSAEDLVTVIWFIAMVAIAIECIAGFIAGEREMPEIKEVKPYRTRKNVRLISRKVRFPAEARVLEDAVTPVVSSEAAEIEFFGFPLETMLTFAVQQAKVEKAQAHPWALTGFAFSS